MKQHIGSTSHYKNSAAGFSLPELLIVLVVAAVIFGIAVPELMQTYRNYQLTDAANRAAAVIKVTRFDAIRRNVPINAQFRTAAGGVTVWDDSNGDAVEQPRKTKRF